jgi:hypothetical protein
MKQLYLFFLLAVSMTVKSQTIEQSISGPHTTSQFSSVKYDPTDSGTINAGYIYDSSNTTGRDWFLVKLDKNQNIVWQKVFQNTGDDFIYKAIVCTNGDYVVVGEFTQNDIHRGLICRINSLNGKIKWSHITATTPIGEIFYDVVETKNKNLAIAASDQWAPGSVNCFIILLNSAGKTLWSKISTYNNSDEAFTINQLPNGNLIVGIAEWNNNHNLVIIELEEATGKILSESFHGISATLAHSGQQLNSVWPWGITVEHGQVTVYAQAFDGCCGKISMCIYTYDTVSKDLSGNIYYHAGDVNGIAYAYVPLANEDYLIAESFTNPNKVYVSRVTNGAIVYDDVVNDSVISINALDTTFTNAVFSGAVNLKSHADTYSLFAPQTDPAASCGITSVHTLGLQASILTAVATADIGLISGGVIDTCSLLNVATVYSVTNICGKCENGSDLKTTHITSTSATLKWTASNDPVKWQIQYKPLNSADWTGIKVNGTSRYVRLLSLTPNQQYKWRIRARCDSTWTAYSNQQSFTTLASSPENAFVETLSSLSVTPNPSRGLLTMDLASAKSGRITVKIYDQLGKEIFAQSEFAIKGNNTYHLDLSNAAPGVYYLEVINNQEQTRVKFMIEK